MCQLCGPEQSVLRLLPTQAFTCKEQRDAMETARCNLLEEDAVPDFLVDVGNDHADVIPPAVERGCSLSVQGPAASVQLYLGFSTRQGLVDLL